MRRISPLEQDILILFAFYAILIFVSGCIASIGAKIYQYWKKY